MIEAELSGALRDALNERERRRRLAECANNIEGRPSVFRLSRSGDKDLLLEMLKLHHGPAPST